MTTLRDRGLSASQRKTTTTWRGLSMRLADAYQGILAVDPSADASARATRQ
jgi:hypothetical protein